MTVGAVFEDAFDAPCQLPEIRSIDTPEWVANPALSCSALYRGKAGRFRFS